MYSQQQLHTPEMSQWYIREAQDLPKHMVVLDFWGGRYRLFGLACLKERTISQRNEDSSFWLGKISYYRLHGLFIPTNRASGTWAAK